MTVLPSAPPDVAAVLHLITRDPGRPRLTWYGPDGERIELSGHVLENWVNKTANLLLEELDVEPGSRLVLDLPAHWRTVVWALATWRAGGTVVLATSQGPADGRTVDGDEADVVVSARPDRWPGARQLAAVTLPALARRYEGTLPAGAVDAAGAVMTYGDVLGYAAPAEPGDPALVGPAEVVTQQRLIAWAVQTSPEVSAGARVALSAPAGPAGLLDLFATTLATLAGDGSLVLLDRASADGLAQDPDRLQALLGSENVTEAHALEAGPGRPAGDDPS